MSKKPGYNHSQISNCSLWNSPSLKVKIQDFLIKSWERCALNPNSVLCTEQAQSQGFSALNPESALNPRTLNPGTTVNNSDVNHSWKWSTFGVPAFIVKKWVDFSFFECSAEWG